MLPCASLTLSLGGAGVAVGVGIAIAVGVDVLLSAGICVGLAGNVPVTSVPSHPRISRLLAGTLRHPTPSFAKSQATVLVQVMGYTDHAAS